MTADDVLSAYRAGYRVGYFWGRQDELKDAAYDDRTPLEKSEEKAQSHEPRPSGDE